ncbi:MAG: metallophosphoesterase, partial [bacterium]
MLYVIGDLHLSFEAEKPMDIFGKEWENHAEKLREGFRCVGEGDTTVIAGDLTWGMEMASCLEDFRFIHRLPGRKILLKGNHDLWFTTASAARRFFAANGIDSMDILNNNCFFVDGVAICGTRGWFCPPEGGTEHDRKIMAREVLRLEASLKAAGDAGRKLVFLHYPPFYGRFRSAAMVELLHAYGVRECYYGHIHGAGRL